jgi:dolichol-phosphate mannosyltransferase
MNKIVIIIPTYNEKENIGRMIDVLESEIFPKIKTAQMEILVVDDKSPDGTAEIVQDKMKSFKNVTLNLGNKQGLGAAYKRGMEYAMKEMQADAVVEFDADFQHDPKHIIDLVEKFDEGFDYVIGSRFVKGGSIPKDWGIDRKFLTIFGGLFSRTVLFFPNINKVKDVSTGLKLTRVKNVLDKVDFSKIANDFCYKTQILYQIVNMGAKVIEIPLQFKTREKGETKMGFNTIIGTFKAIILLRLTDPKTLRFIKFGTVGFLGFIVNFFFLRLFRNLGFAEIFAWLFSTELAIVNNYILNNSWTFSADKIGGFKKTVVKFLQFNLTSAGALAIQSIFGPLGIKLVGVKYDYLVLMVVIVLLVLPYNYFMYNKVIWKTGKSAKKK